MIELRSYQVEAANALLAAKSGIVKAPAGSGKTIIAAAAIDRWLGEDSGMAVVWYANTVEQCQQAEAACAHFSLRNRLGKLHICCYQSGEQARNYDLAVLDEVHHVASPEFRKVLDGYAGPRWGFSATPDRADDLKDAVYTLCGPIVYEVDRAELVDSGKLAPAKVIFHAPNERDELQEMIEGDAASRLEAMKGAIPFTAAKMRNKSIEQIARLLGGDDYTQILLLSEKAGIDAEAPFSSWMDIGKPREWLRQAAEKELLSRCRWHACQSLGIAENEKRNERVTELANKHLFGCVLRDGKAAGTGDSVLILVGSIEHGKLLQTMIPGSAMMHSKMGVKKRREAMEAFRSGELKCAIATSLADEGLDVPRANVLILAAAGRSAAKAEQRTGRVLRSWSDKTHGIIHDLWDWQHPLLLNQARARAKIYASLGYEFAAAEPSDLLPVILKSVGIGRHPALPMIERKGRKNLSDVRHAAEETSGVTTEDSSSAHCGSVGGGGGSESRSLKISEKSSCEVESTQLHSATLKLATETKPAGLHKPTSCGGGGGQAPVVGSTPTPHSPISEIKAAEPQTQPTPALAHATREHAKLSPSTLKSKAICPGFVNDPDGDKSFADRGSLGHEAVEKEDTSICKTKDGKFDEDLAKAAQSCIDYKRMIAGLPFTKDYTLFPNKSEAFQEIKLRYFDQFGYADVLFIEANDRDAHLLDWKFAFNFYPADTPQFWAYCLGVWNAFPKVEKVTVHVGHPFRDEIDVEVFTRKEHYAKFTAQVAAIIGWARGNDPAHYQITEQCLYCGFRSKCTKLASLGMEIARRYAPEPLELPAEGSLHGSEITDPQIIAVLHQIAPLVEKAAGGWKKRALDMWDDGTAIPGYELIERKGKRALSSALAGLEIAKGYGVSEEQFLNLCSVSAPQLIETVAAGAPRGDKKKLADEFESRLIDADLLTTGENVRFLKKIKK